MNYFIIVKTGWTFAAQEFSAQLRERWPIAQIDEIQDPDDSEVLEFKLPMEKSRIYGSLNREGNAVIFVGGFQDCSRFAQWCRSLIPPTEKVVFCDESMSINFVLEPSMTPEEIVQAARSS
ncbi:hypothetical protein [Vitiosangium sp. GDMCC 1.1324]|uniref:hypothetical protein n=1 Tax=Vitiosangium sp. (strain GDMCC 1.1324) TaxID=2138576 RepID=UPI000D344B0F|nr:hypothetical protein [Vitiosangium sp. GDMCC 1.1324]PTL81805.1 hypothetical protein DAT35_22980 [Vitiosangium sp. GDMCC 1.1324]